MCHSDHRRSRKCHLMSASFIFGVCEVVTTISKRQMCFWNLGIHVAELVYKLCKYMLLDH